MLIAESLEDRVRRRRRRFEHMAPGGSHLLRASPCGQQTTKPPRPRKSLDGGSIPGPVRHFWDVIRAGAWRGSCHLSPDSIVAIVLFQPAAPPD
ncbi:hypothetical protein, partial [Mesorhizobium sp. M5C.F.Ca.IN.020.29.1.1]|uniref:hypothetical protein n=1 Tax=Mesorhizobium sp. M5C.F.Ca.IN.020.29.1.1 TaxID=2496770 RepID=UPI0019D19A05